MGRRKKKEKPIPIMCRPRRSPTEFSSAAKLYNVVFRLGVAVCLFSVGVRGGSEEVGSWQRFFSARELKIKVSAVSSPPFPCWNGRRYNRWHLNSDKYRATDLLRCRAKIDARNKWNFVLFLFYTSVNRFCILLCREGGKIEFLISHNV